MNNPAGFPRAIKLGSKEKCGKGGANDMTLRVYTAIQMMKGLLAQRDSDGGSICRDVWDEQLIARAYSLADMIIEEDSVDAQNPKEEVLGNG